MTNVINTLLGKKELKYKEKTKKRIIYFIVEDKETGDIWVDKRDYNDMKSKYNPYGWTYEDVSGPNGYIIVETISRSDLNDKFKKIKPVPLGFKIDQDLKDDLEKIAKEKNTSLIDVTRTALCEYVNKNKK